MTEPTRRDFLKLATTGLLTAAGLVGLGGLIRYLDYESDPAHNTVIDLGSRTQYPVGSRTVLPDIPAILIAEPGGFNALSLVCTHLGCTVEQSPNGFQCPCHGSRYSADGAVQRGPARQPLRQLQIETTKDGRLLLHLAP
ncbi:MAG TPA: ubiquinol-cytochrome c reductase iron-sulfur subunit [Anaerolineales bacterium]|nr:ubiquinol-cytochrome c reductase iron-sulfur subunit [Anaerolineales bacterium]